MTQCWYALGCDAEPSWPYPDGIAQFLSTDNENRATAAACVDSAHEAMTAEVAAAKMPPQAPEKFVSGASGLPSTF